MSIKNFENKLHTIFYKLFCLRVSNRYLTIKHKIHSSKYIGFWFEGIVYPNT